MTREPVFAALKRVVQVHSGEEFGADDFPTLEDGKRAATELAALLDVAEAAEAHVISRRDRLPSEWPRLLSALDRLRDANSHSRADA